MGKREKRQARLLSDPGWQEAQPPASFLHQDASPSLITILAQSLVFLEPPDLFERFCSLREWEEVPSGVSLPGCSPR